MDKSSRLVCAFISRAVSKQWFKIILRLNRENLILRYDQFCACAFSILLVGMKLGDFLFSLFAAC